ncbi:hypothetical protein AQUCO_01000253v1 [Aquilegia coerulea]|uniref:Uncharacterized protein n=1 Tax=Aquilegia coerulea TaxID=218851 RepID=A0A2G5E922_AQUCA|nr:hypothetical protein AQUCO_01000253v1 [Aquilegia coerulea]
MLICSSIIKLFQHRHEGLDLTAREYPRRNMAMYTYFIIDLFHILRVTFMYTCFIISYIKSYFYVYDGPTPTFSQKETTFMSLCGSA